MASEQVEKCSDVNKTVSAIVQKWGAPREGTGGSAAGRAWASERLRWWLSSAPPRFVLLCFFLPFSANGVACSQIQRRSPSTMAPCATQCCFISRVNPYGCSLLFMKRKPSFFKEHYGNPGFTWQKWNRKEFSWSLWPVPFLLFLGFSLILSPLDLEASLVNLLSFSPLNIFSFLFFLFCFYP